MNTDRNLILDEFKKSQILQEVSSLSLNEIDSLNFSDKADDVVIEAIKTMILSYSTGDPEVTIRRKINLKIEEMIKRDSK
jgi:hypothetical protein